MRHERSLYAQAMGAEFDRLDDVVRRFHSLRGRVRLAGRCTVDGPTSWVGRCFGRIVGVPVTRVEDDFVFELDADATQERWTRRFPHMTMRSRMRLADGQLVERLGPVAFRFRLHVVDGGLDMALVRMTVLGLPWPRWLAPSITARETGREGHFHFEVAASLPILGRVTAYEGYLVLPTAP
ncbi:protein of unknown function [Luteibacter sp. UNCMF331Sha3.1]|uniref:DUF4166 domain-containing protein n=1 Tax=Luteibacter sp. UNCMF331Sha3.1 TaxID=1502760 RepID=UPI0008CC3AE3|nr:DUF4166 domain-containing protein [Luteibacter sp. UNCMF331Sha3.1]SEN06691.1 protein of unknown function [Luteibacter sp. UNCMF331Sha3.1]